MSDTVAGDGLDPDVDPAICEVCGCPIEALDQQCPARDDGRCYA